MDEAQRLHDGVELSLERLAAAHEGARFERRDGYTFTAFPMLRVRAINGVFADTDAAAAKLEEALAEAEELDAPAVVTVREGRTPAVEEAARRLGLTREERMPGMVMRPDELRAHSVAEAQIVRVETADGLAEALAVAAAGFGAPAAGIAPLYGLETATLGGFAHYLVRVEGRDVSTAAGLTAGGGVGIFMVATPPEHRRRGYGAAVTAQAVRDGFASGAEFAYLQSSEIGESVYRRLGFRQVETYTLLTRPR